MRIESGACYVIILALGISVIVQIIVFDFDIIHIAGEMIVLLIGVAWALIGYIRRGIYDNFTKPGIKSYIAYSAVVGIIYGILGYFRFDSSFSDFLPILAFRFLWLFVIMFVMLSLIGSIIKMRTKKLQQKYEEDDI